MKKALLAAALLGLMATTWVTAAMGQIAPTAPRKKPVAVFDFYYATVHGGVAAIFGQDVDIGKGGSHLLVKDLGKDGSVSLLETKALAKYMQRGSFCAS